MQPSDGTNNRFASKHRRGGGSVASSIHGIPRATQDIDLVAEIRRMHAKPLADALKADFYVDQDAILDAVLRRPSFNLVHLDTMTKVDVFVPKGDPLSSAQIRRRQFVQVGTTSVSTGSHVRIGGRACRISRRAMAW